MVADHYLYWLALNAVVSTTEHLQSKLPENVCNHAGRNSVRMYSLVRVNLIWLFMCTKWTSCLQLLHVRIAHLEYLQPLAKHDGEKYDCREAVVKMWSQATQWCDHTVFTQPCWTARHKIASVSNTLHSASVVRIYIPESVIWGRHFARKITINYLQKCYDLGQWPLQFLRATWAFLANFGPVILWVWLPDGPTWPGKPTVPVLRILCSWMGFFTKMKATSFTGCFLFCHVFINEDSYLMPLFVKSCCYPRKLIVHKTAIFVSSVLTPT